MNIERSSSTLGSCEPEALWLSCGKNIRPQLPTDGPCFVRDESHQCLPTVLINVASTSRMPTRPTRFALLRKDAVKQRRVRLSGTQVLFWGC
jgi:hypothetical protein